MCCDLMVPPIVIPPLITVMVLLTQSCCFDMFACWEVWRLAWPPGAGTEQEVLLATVVTTHLTDTIAAQLSQTATAGQDFHIKVNATQFQSLDYSQP